MTANIGVTIPVIVRHGNVTGDAKIENMRVLESTQTESKKTELYFEINRSGNGSALGKAEVLWQPSNGSEEKIGSISNMNVFHETNKRYVNIPLSKRPLGSGRIILRYHNDLKKGTLYDEAILQQ